MWRGLLAAAVAVLLALVGIQSTRAQGTTLNVCSGCNHTTIQAAINAASAGDTIQVAAGTYSENINITRRVNLLGANANVAAGYNGASRSAASVIAGAIDLTSAAASSTINGFTITGGTQNGGGFHGVRINSGANSVTVTNNIIDGNNSLSNTQGVEIGANLTGILIKDNEIKEFASGVYVNSGATVQVIGNDIHHVFAGVGNDSNNLTVQLNRITNATEGVGLGASGNIVITSNIIDVSTVTNPVAHYAGTATVNASGNWWGTTNVTSITGGMLSSGSVGTSRIDFSPYLESATDADPAAAGFQGNFLNVWVTPLGMQSGSTGRVQEGVNLVTSGGTINVAAGTYREAVTISKAVSILGPFATVPGTDISRSASNDTGEATIAGTIKVASTGSVTIAGLRFLADATTGVGGPSNPSLQRQAASSGGSHSYRNNIFYSTVAGGDNNTNYRAISFEVLSSGTTLVEGNYITGSQTGKYGTASWNRGVWSDGGGTSGITIQNNTFQYVRTGVTADVAGTATVQISNNTIRTAGTAISAGINAATQLGNISSLLVDDVDTTFNFQNLTAPLTFAAGSAIASTTAANQIVTTLGGSASDMLTGSANPDVVDGKNGDDQISALAGNDMIVGGAGNDTAIFSGNYADYTISFSGANILVSGTDGNDSVTSVEKLQFADKAVIVVGSAAGSAYTTIAGGITAANGGDVVLVAPGTYAENVTVNKAVTIAGSGSGSDPATNTIIAPASGTALNITASDVTIDTLRIAGASNISISNVGIYIYSNSIIQNLTLSNLVVTNHGYGITIHNNAVISGLTMTNVTATSNNIGLRSATSGAANNVTITNSAFNDNDYGWMINATHAKTNNQNDFQNVTVSNTTFNNNRFKGLYAEKLHNATFTNITVNGSGYGTTSPNGININLKYGTFASIAFTGLTVTNSGTGTPTGAGVAIAARNDASSYNTNPASLSGLSFTNTSITGSTYQLSIANAISGVTLSGVSINGTGVGLLSYGSAQGNPASFDLGNTTFASSLSAHIVNSGASTTITGTGATFGTVAAGSALSTADAFTIVDKVLDSVDVSTYGTVILKSGNVYVTPNSYVSPATAASVQNAVTAASAGDTVWVQTGAYAAASATATVNNLTVNVPTGVTGFTGVTLDAAVTNGSVTLSGDGAANLTGNVGNNVLTGNAGGNTLNGGAGADTLNGGLGDDVFVVDGSDTVTEAASEGVDTMRGDVSFTLAANVENGELTGTGNVDLTGNGEANILTGNAGANVLTGNAGADTLNGGAGNDTLNGGTGTNEIDGGTGVDTAVYAGEYSFSRVSGGAYLFVKVAAEVSSEQDKIANIEKLQFANRTVLLVGMHGSEYTTTQAAIDAASPGDVVLVGPGTYAEVININKPNLEVVSLYGPATTRIEGASLDPNGSYAVRFSANGVRLQDFTVSNLNAPNGRAIAPTNSSGATIINNIIVEAFRGIQGDFYGAPQNLTISMNTFASSVSYGIAGTEGMSIMSINANTFRTSVEGIGLGVGVGLPGTVDELFAAQTWQLPSGYAIKDYRDASLPIVGAPYLAIPADLVIYQGAADSAQPAGVNLTATLPISLYTNSHAINAATFSLASSSCFNVAGNDPTTAVQLASGQPTGTILGATLNSADGALDIVVYAPVNGSLSNGPLITVQVNYNSSSSCLNPVDGSTAVGFVAGQTSFGSVQGLALVAGGSQNGSLRPRWGDCNGNGSVDAADISACIAEIFDRDGTNRSAARYGTAANNFPGTIWCDSNQDIQINAGDIVCTVRRINNLTCTAVASAGMAEASVSVASAVLSEQTVQAALSLNASGAAAAVFFVLAVDPAYSFDATDYDGNGLPDALQLAIPADYQAVAVYDADARLLQLMVASLNVSAAPLNDGTLGTITLTHAGATAEPISIQEVSVGGINGESLPVQGLVVETPVEVQPELNNRLYLPTVTR